MHGARTRRGPIARKRSRLHCLVSLSTKHCFRRQHDECSDVFVDPRKGSILCRFRIRLSIEYAYGGNIAVATVYRPVRVKSWRGFQNRYQARHYCLAHFNRTAPQTILADSYIHCRLSFLDTFPIWIF